MMTRTHRDRLKKVLGHALRNIRLAQTHLLDLNQVFAPQHPDMASSLDMIMAGLEICLEATEQFSLQAWGYVVPVVERWRDTEMGEEEDTDDAEAD